MLFTEGFILIFIQLSEHLPAAHMMPIQNVIRAGFQYIAVFIHKNSTVFIIFLIHVMVQIVLIIHSLHHGIIYGRTVDFHPANQLSVLQQQVFIFFQHFFLFRFPVQSIQRSLRRGVTASAEDAAISFISLSF